MDREDVPLPTQGACSAMEEEDILLEEMPPDKISLKDIYVLLRCMQKENIKTKETYASCIEGLRGDIVKLGTKIDNIHIRVEDIEYGTSKLEEDAGEIGVRCTDLITEVTSIRRELTDRMDCLEKQLQDQLNVEFEYDKTLVASYLEDDGRDVWQQATDLLEKGLGDVTPVIRALRLPSHNQNPGIVKIELPSKEDKTRILKKKSVLKGKEAYSGIYLRSSQPHTERLLISNVRSMFETIPVLKEQFNLTGNGRLVRRQQYSHANNYRVFTNSNWEKRDSQHLNTSKASAGSRGEQDTFGYTGMSPRSAQSDMEH